MGSVDSCSPMLSKNDRFGLKPHKVETSEDVTIVTDKRQQRECEELAKSL